MKKQRVIFLLITMVMVLGAGATVYAATYSTSRTIKSEECQYAFAATLIYEAKFGLDTGRYATAISGEDKVYETLEYDIYVRRGEEGNWKYKEYVSNEKIGGVTKKYGRSWSKSFSDAESLRCSVKIDGRERYVSVTNNEY